MWPLVTALSSFIKQHETLVITANVLLAGIQLCAVATEVILKVLNQQNL